MKRIFYIIVLFVIAIAITNSCAPLYVPNVVNTPMLRESKDLNVSGHIGTSGFDAQGAYAVTDNFAIMLNGSFLNTNSTDTNNYQKHIFVEAGIGYYKPINKYFIFDVYSGYGIGKIKANTNGIYNSNSDTYVNRIFLQPSFGFVSPYFEAAITPRSVVALTTENSQQITGYFIEPAVILKAGAPNFKLVAQVGLSYMLNHQERYIDYQPFIFSMGLQYSLRSKESRNKF